MTQPTIAAVLIVKDEDAVLADCLRSVAWADERVVYDTGSTDATVAIARELATHVVEGYWDDDFGGARNRAIAHATADWILVLDADEVFDGDPQNLRTRLASGAAPLWTVPVENTGSGGASGATINVRIFRRGDYRYEGRLHEQVAPARPGAPWRVENVPNARLLHSGYGEAAMERHAKKERNLALARISLREAEKLADPVQIGIAQAHVARSLAMAEHHEDALALAEQVLADGCTPDGTLSQLASTCVGLLASRDDDGALLRWVGVWRSNDYSTVWADATLARIYASQDRPAQTLEVLDRLPTTTVDRAGRRFVKHELAQVEAWALGALGRRRDAADVVVRAARAGYTSVTPRDVIQLLDGTRGGPARLVDALAAASSATVWRQYALWCAAAADESSLHLLHLMHERRPGDPAVLVCAATLGPLLALEEAAFWSAAIRRADVPELCPLVALAGNERRSVRDRALAAAMAVDLHADQRAVGPLEAALASVAPRDEAALFAELEVVAPGLVSATAV